MKRIISWLFPRKWGVFLRNVDGRYDCRILRRLGGDMSPHFESDGMSSRSLVTYQQEKTFRTLRGARRWKLEKFQEEPAYW